jgi:hypothetical protein
VRDERITALFRSRHINININIVNGYWLCYEHAESRGYMHRVVNKILNYRACCHFISPSSSSSPDEIKALTLQVAG